MDTEYLIDFRSQGVRQCTAEVVRSNNYMRETVKSTTSQSLSVIRRKKNQTSRHNSRLFANNQQVNNSAYRDIIYPTSEFRGLTGSSSILSLMLSPIARLVARPIANLVTSPLVSFIASPIAKFIVNPVTSFIANRMAILSLMPSTIASPIISKELNEVQLVRIGTVGSWYHKPIEELDERQLIQIGLEKSQDYKSTDISMEINERQLIQIGTAYHKPIEVNERKPIQTGTQESWHYNQTFTSAFSSDSHLAMTATTFVRNSFSSHFVNTK